MSLANHADASIYSYLTAVKSLIVYYGKDKHESTIVIRNSKGQKTRTVEYGQSLRKVLVDYCKVRGGLPKNTLIDSYKEQDVALTIRGIQWIVKEIVRRSGIKKNVSPHTFRHTFAVHYLNRGGSIFRLQQLMGHEYITTTLHYLKYASIPDSIRVSLLDHLYSENPEI